MVSSMVSLLRSFVVLSLLVGYVSTTEARPKTVSRYGSLEPPLDETPISDGDGDAGFFDKIRFGDDQKPLPRDEVQAPPENEPDPGGPAKILGSWKIHSQNARVSAMHIQLMPNGKAIMYDSTSNGLSEIKLNPPSCTRRVGGRPKDPRMDCTAHAIEYDVETAEIRTLKLETSPWCSSGGLSKNGDLVSTGGDKGGFQSMRILKPCPTCDFQESTRALYANRWYATQHALENGSFVLVGGRNAYNYEIIPPDTLEFTPQLRELPLLEETEDDGGRENNLYPFVNLLPDGNLFVFANYKSIILNPYTGETLRKLPDLPGGSRNYPPSGMSALLPINLNDDLIDVQVLVCGGNTRDSYTLSDLQQPKRTFIEASKDCGRLRLDTRGADGGDQWEIEDMPSPRVMGDMLLLPNGDVLMINGAKAGTSAWNAAKDPNLTPVLYNPNEKKGRRFRELAPTNIARMYHSVSAVLPSGEVLVAGSNTNPFYMMEKYGDDFTFPTELRVEKFSPPYMAPEQIKYRVEILKGVSDHRLKYGGVFNVGINSKGNDIDEEGGDVKVTMYAPPFTTHGYSQNQRLLILKLKEVKKHKITAIAPPSAALAPPGYYLLFVVYRHIPSRGVWVHIQ